MGKQIFPIISTWVLHHLYIITGNQSVFILETNDNLKYMYLKDYIFSFLFCGFYIKYSNGVNIYNRKTL